VLCQNGMVRQDLCAGRAASRDLYVLSDRQEGVGILVFPQVTQGGLAVARDAYGEGVLQINGKTVDYYRITSARLG